MFKPDESIDIVYEDYTLENLEIGKAGFFDVDEIGGDAHCHEPDNTTYEESVRSEYSYGHDYVVLKIDNWRLGYFIGAIGYNSVDTKYTKASDPVYALYEIWLNIGYQENEEPTTFFLLFEYLLRHCKSNNCKILQIKKDVNNRYRLFYEHIKSKYDFEEFDDYLIKKID